MSNRLEWIFGVIDRMSGPLAKMNKALGGVDRALGKTNQAMQRLDKVSTRGLGEKLRSGLGAVGKGISAGAAQIGEVLSTIGPIALGAGAAAAGLATAGAHWLISSAAFKETTIASLEALLGSQDAAQAVFKQATAFAAKTPFQTSQVASAFEMLISQGFRPDQLEKMMTSIGDFAGTDLEKLKSSIEVFGQIRSLGKLTFEDLKQLGSRGLPLEKVYQQLATNLGKSVDEVKRMVSAGSIDADTGLAAITGAMDAQFGGRMEKAANTLEGLWSTLKSAPEDIFFSLDMSSMIGPVRAFVKDMIALLGPEGPGGKAMQGLFTKGGELIGGIATALRGVDWGHWIGKLTGIAQTAWPLVERLGKAFASVFSGGDAASSFENILTAIQDRLDNIDPRTLDTVGKVLGVVAKVVVTVGEWLLRLHFFLMSLGDKWASTWQDIIAWVDAAKEKVKPFADELRAEFQKIWGKLQAIWTRLSGAVDRLLEKLKPLEPVFERIWAVIKKVGSIVFGATLLPILAALWVGFQLLVFGLELIAAALDLVLGAWDQIEAFFDGLSDKIEGMSWSEIGITIVEGILLGILSMMDPAGLVMGELGDKLKSSLKAKVGLGQVDAATSKMPVSPTTKVFSPSSVMPSIPGVTPSKTDVMTSQPWFAAMNPGAQTGNQSPLDLWNAQHGQASPGTPPAIQPAAGTRPVVDAATAVGAKRETVNNLNVAPGAVVINVAAGDDPASAGKAAADGFMSQLGSALKGLAGEAGG